MSEFLFEVVDINVEGGKYKSGDCWFDSFKYLNFLPFVSEIDTKIASPAGREPDSI